MAQDQRDADLVVALTGCHDRDGIRNAVTALRDDVKAVGPSMRTLVLCGDAGWEPGERGDGLDGVVVAPTTFEVTPRVPMVTSHPQDPYRLLFAAGLKAQASAALLLGSPACDITPEIVERLIRPVVEAHVDVVTPLYRRHTFDGLLNGGVVYPLTRALYGKRVEGQIGLDYAFSARVAARWTRDADAPPKPGQASWILPQALCDGWPVSQASLPTRLAPMSESADLSSVIAQILGPLFLDMERHAPVWQRVQQSQPVPVAGSRSETNAIDESEDVRPMIESFHLAYRSLYEVWAFLLPPGTIVELKRLTGEPADAFRLPDTLWARVLFDFALGHRLRTISRDHLLRALTPLYLAWVASFALEMRGQTRAAADGRLERLCLAFEAEKPYLVRRWRWPDRFNP
jgi:glucosylglycerate synthase